MQKFLIPALLLFLCVYLCAKKGDPSKSFTEAMRLYNLLEPTEATDSLALLLFKQASDHTGSSLNIKIEALNNIANIYQTRQQYKLANEQYKKALNLNLSQSKPDKKLLYETYLFFGSSLYSTNVIDTAQRYFENAIALVEQGEQPSKLPEIERLYNSLGAIYFESANYTQAKNYFEKALDYLKTSSDVQESSLVIKCNISTCYLKMKDGKAALNVINSLQPNESQVNVVTQLKAHIFFEMGNIEMARKTYEAVKVEKNVNGVIALLDIARIHIRKNNSSEAEQKLNLAISYAKELSNNNKNQEEANAYYYRGQLALQQGFIDEALRWNNYALQEADLTFNTDSVFALPTKVDASVSPGILYNILIDRAKMLGKKYNQTKVSEFLKSSINAFKLAIATEDYIKRNLDNDEAKQFLINDSKAVFGQALDAAYQYHNSVSEIPEDIIFILEYYKGSILSQNLENTKLKSIGKIPDSLLRRESELKQYMAYFTAKLSKAQSPVDVKETSERILNYRVQLSRINALFDNDTSLTQYRKKVFVPESLSSTQSRISGNLCLLNYFKHDSLLFIATITKNKFEIVKQAKVAEVDKNLTNYLRSLYQTQEGQRYWGHEAAHNLYRLLIKPMESVIAKKSLVILPDEKLHGVPFEALEFSKDVKTYLLARHQISYHYSIHLLLNDTKGLLLQNSSVISFAPFIKADSNINRIKLAPLSYSALEVDGIGGQIFKASEANKTSFISKVNNFGIAHLATHANVDPTTGNAWINFYPTDTTEFNHQMSLAEVNNLQLDHTKLVVLSACETAQGTNFSGEGLMSLSRSFIYAGADGVVSTYWKTDDWVTNYIIQKFYSFIKEGATPELALHNAKLALIADKSVSSKYKMPNYWANFAYTGIVSNKKENKVNLTVWLALGLLVLFTIFYYLIKKRQATR